MSDTGQHEDGTPFQSRDDGQLHFEPGTAANTFPVAAPVDATPLEEDEPEGTVPPSPLWAMKERAHGGIHVFGHPARIRARAGEGDAAVFAIDDGPHHCMIGRRVGATGDGPWAMLDEGGTLLAVYEATGTDRIKPAVVLSGS